MSVFLNFSLANVTVIWKLPHKFTHVGQFVAHFKVAGNGIGPIGWHFAFDIFRKQILILNVNHYFGLIQEGGYGNLCLCKNLTFLRVYKYIQHTIKVLIVLFDFSG